MADMTDLLFNAGIPLGEDRVSALNIYHGMLLDWNTRMDLTSVPDAEVANRHFLDSLLPLTLKDYFPQGLRLIDVGTGAGFPGLALAIARPDFQVTLLEAQGKRCTFLQAVCDELRLQNVAVCQERAEVLGRAEGYREAYGLAVARAVAPLNVLCEYLLPFVKVGGSAFCWKGPAVAGEMEDGAAAARKLGGTIDAPISLSLPDAERLLVSIRKTETTPPQYPRKNGIPAKRPLKKDK
ncbi:MAG: 16S rRNA (guanine(527)-N(7))-methyltransferase RsmG [Clostridia bacterium]|nr:16S rRNA (guanine(527)-N(7))-methyltransferase RsmG [Clostridia bacterium]